MSNVVVSLSVVRVQSIGSSIGSSMSIGPAVQYASRFSSRQSIDPVDVDRSQLLLLPIVVNRSSSVDRSSRFSRKCQKSFAVDSRFSMSIDPVNVTAS
jgi:hypothetical protein